MYAGLESHLEGCNAIDVSGRSKSAVVEGSHVK